MWTVSTLAAGHPADGSPDLLVFDSFLVGKRLVTAVVQAPEGDHVLARLAKQTRDFAIVHLRSFGAWGAVHLVQIFDLDTARSRVADVLATSKAGALVIFFGRTADECKVLVEALGVEVMSAGTAAVH